ncbi:unnamed protein product, partial [Brenthis ino]
MSVEVKSSFFSPAISQTTVQESSSDISDELLELIDELNESLNNFSLPTAVKCVYNPSIYARYTFEMYIRKYCNTKKKIMYFGMNPGPWGMSQTGVPFGEVSAVKDWLKIEGPVGKPPNEIKERPVNGFNCKRTEISGKRFWGLVKNICGDPDIFFKTSFVYNYINQQWMKCNGCNLTPGDFKVSEIEGLYNICDPIFIKVLKLYEVEIIVAIGNFCKIRADKALKKYLPSSNIKVLCLSHPSPRTVNNTNWDEKALQQLKDYDLLKYYKEE